MGDIADMMLEGQMCQGCGELLSDGLDFPHFCPACSRELQPASQEPVRKARQKVRCGKCGKRVWENGLQQHYIAKVNSNEKMVWDSLASRPAGIRHNLPLVAQRTFDALFNGTLPIGTFTPIGLKIGKHEAEEDWPKSWELLRDNGLIQFQVKFIPNALRFGGSTKRLYWSITDLGQIVREDDLEWFRELITAREGTDDVTKQGA